MRPGWQARMAGALLQERRALLAFILGSAGLQALALGMPLLLKEVVDRLLVGNPGLRVMLLLGGAVLGLSLHRVVLLWVRDAALRTIEAQVSAATLRSLAEDLMRTPLAHAATQALGGRVHTLRSSQEVLGFIFERALAPALDALLGLSYLGLLAYYLPTVALLLLLLCILPMGLAWRLGDKQAAEQREETHAATNSRALLSELVAGVLPLRLSAAEDRYVRRWHSALEATLRAGYHRLGAGLLVDLAYGFSRYLAIPLTLLLSAQHVLRGALSIGGLVAALMLQQAFFAAMLPLCLVLYRLRLTLVHVQRVERALVPEASGFAGSGATPAAHPDAPLSFEEPAICLSEVWFRYGPAAPWVLRGQDFTVPRGACLRLRGPSGAGKTTLLRLIAGFYQPERGEVLLGGRRSCEAREHVLYLPQRTVLFEGTIWTNLLLLSGEASEERILMAAERTGLADFCRRLPLGMHTPVLAGGGLSGGQQQHVMLTACVASLRPVVLLDEPFASLDGLLRERLSPGDLFAGRTLIYTDQDAHQDAHQDRRKDESQGSHAAEEEADEGQSIRLSLHALDSD